MVRLFLVDRSIDVNENKVVRAKCSLVIGGLIQQEGVYYFDKCSPTPSASFTRCLARVALRNDFKSSHLDLRQASEQAPLNEDVYMKLSLWCGDFSGVFVKFNKRLHCLKKASINPISG